MWAAGWQNSTFFTRDITIRVGFNTQVAKTSTYPAMCRFPLFVALCIITDHHRIELNWARFNVPPTRHIIGHIGDGFYRSKDPTNMVKALKELILNRAVADGQLTIPCNWMVARWMNTPQTNNILLYHRGNNISHVVVFGSALDKNSWGAVLWRIQRESV